MSTTKTSRHTTLQMYPGNHIPAGVISYGCKCKTLAVINRRDAAWIVKRCGRVLRATGGHVDLHVSHGELVGEHFNGRTTFPASLTEALLRRIGHGACGVHISTDKARHMLHVNMEGHAFFVPRGTGLSVAHCSLGDALIRGSEDA